MTAATPGPPPRDRRDGQVTYEALRDFYWHEMDTLESGKPGYSYISDASLDKLEELFTAALPDALGVQPAPGLAALRKALGETAALHLTAAAERDKLRALLDHETRLTWQAGLPGERARIATVREQAGLEAL